MDPRRAGLQLRLLSAVLRAARPTERTGVAERASAILEQMAGDIGPGDDPDLTSLLEEVRAEIQAAREQT
ncbi:MAG TPA: hypothetical protein VFH90_01085 [Candidatus Limnocylindria bacterium]|nr:hypothetical protein [Candidatus Limnocylindria bacterium]